MINNASLEGVQNLLLNNLETILCQSLEDALIKPSVCDHPFRRTTALSPINPHSSVFAAFVTTASDSTEPSNSSEPNQF